MLWMKAYQMILVCPALYKANGPKYSTRNKYWGRNYVGDWDGTDGLADI